MSSSSIFLKPRNLIAVAASGAYIAYRSHDRRALSEHEVAYARGELAQIAPSSPSSTSTPASSTAHTRDSLAAQHLDNLSKCGVTVVRDTLSASQLTEWNKKTKEAFDGTQNNIVWQCGRAYCNITKRHPFRTDMTRIGCGCDDVDATYDDDTIKAKRNSSWFDSFWGIRIRNGSSTEKATTTPLPVSLQDIVQSYFKQHGIERYDLTDVQFLNAYPASTNQVWHRDNTSRGLTAIVALQDVLDNGPTELILGSHQPNFSLWPNCWNVMQKYLPASFKQRYLTDDDDSIPDRPLLGCIDAGDTILYDARLFHRGRGNTTTSEGNGIADRPVLVLRWDAAHTPPPGAGLIVTTANTYAGSFLTAGLFALQKISPTSNAR